MITLGLLVVMVGGAAAWARDWTGAIAAGLVGVAMIIGGAVLP